MKARTATVLRSTSRAPQSAKPLPLGRAESRAADRRRFTAGSQCETINSSVSVRRQTNPGPSVATPVPAATCPRITDDYVQPLVMTRLWECENLTVSRDVQGSEGRLPQRRVSDSCRYDRARRRRLGVATQLRLARFSFPTPWQYGRDRVSRLLLWSGRRGSNPRPTAWEAVTLPLSYSRSPGGPTRYSSKLRSGHATQGLLERRSSSVPGWVILKGCTTPTRVVRTIRRLTTGD